MFNFTRESRLDPYQATLQDAINALNDQAEVLRNIVLLGGTTTNHYPSGRAQVMLGIPDQVVTTYTTTTTTTTTTDTTTTTTTTDTTTTTTTTTTPTSPPEPVPSSVDSADKKPLHIVGYSPTFFAVHSSYDGGTMDGPGGHREGQPPWTYYVSDGLWNDGARPWYRMWRWDGAFLWDESADFGSSGANYRSRCDGQWDIASRTWWIRGREFLLAAGDTASAPAGNTPDVASTVIVVYLAQRNVAPYDYAWIVEIGGFRVYRGSWVGIWTGIKTVGAHPTGVYTKFAGDVGGYDAHSTLELEFIDQVATPTCDEDSGGYVYGTGSVTLHFACATVGATIQVAQDGYPAVPLGLDTPPITIDAGAYGYWGQIDARAFKDGLAGSLSRVLTVTVDVPPPANPTFTPDGGTVDGSTAITIHTGAPTDYVYWWTDDGQSGYGMGNQVIYLPSGYGSDTVYAQTMNGGYAYGYADKNFTVT